jgi:hypothetical protein
MKSVYLLHLCNAYTLGGTTSYLVHLCQQLQELGYNPIILKSIRAKERKPYYNLEVRYLLDADIVQIAQHNPILITNAYLVGHQFLLERILPYDVHVVIHDPLEITQYTKSILHQCRTIITIRESVFQLLKERYPHVIHIPHPYNRVKPAGSHAHLCASVTRLDYIKNIPTILEVATEFPIHLYGQIQGDYASAVLDKAHKGWKKHYHGPMRSTIGIATSILSHYKYSIDLTTIPRDGGGTQYSFLESWDAGALLIVHKNWLLKDGVLKDGVNCLGVASTQDIKEIFIHDKSYDLESMKDYLHLHSAQHVAPQYIHTLCKS